MKTVQLPGGRARHEAAPSDPTGTWADGESTSRPALSRFERIAADNENLPPHFGDLVALLLQAVYIDEGAWRPVLQPLWAEEGMHRAYAMLRLLERRTETHPDGARSMLAANDERALARGLAGCYRSLTGMGEGDFVPCSPVLRELAQNLSALFGGNNGVVVRTEIERISLAAYRRRALVLCASELLVNALTHAFGASSRNARVELSLRRLDERRACLRVADNGIGFSAGSPKPWSSVAGGLADLLEARLRYRRTSEWVTVAEVTFPLPLPPSVGIFGRPPALSGIDRRDAER
jgi:two-component sensor histidine kinase